MVERCSLVVASTGRSLPSFQNADIRVAADVTGLLDHLGLDRAWRARDLRGPIPLLMLPLAAGKQFRERVEEHMFPVGALREHRT